MTNIDPDRPHILTLTEIQSLLSKRLIANLATVNNDGSIHLVPMWFLLVDNNICIPTSHNTHKYRNLMKRSLASVMIDISRAGLNLKGVLIMGQVELVHGQEARQINHSIHLNYVKSEALSDVRVFSYLSEGDDVTVKIHMDRLVTWNLADSNAGKALRVGGWFHPLDDELEGS
jgi:nitroimidazol reductase NimA-like FMN-containing flavoprotein (pyridoxamine 5'-phosphate oxidase superfamily)